MAEKEFTVTHGRARSPLVIRGKSLKDALKKEGLNPGIWKPVSPQKSDQLSAGQEPGYEDAPC